MNINNTISKAKLIQAYKELDLFRAKYRHADFTPYAWCFHGDEAQGWQQDFLPATIKDHRLVIEGDTNTVGTINSPTATHKYINIDVVIPSYWIRRSDGVQVSRPKDIAYEVSVLLLVTAPDLHQEFIWRHVDITENSSLVRIDMSDEPLWVGTLSVMSIDVDIKTPGYDIYEPVAFINYIKVDSIDLFASIKNATTVTADIMNNLRQTVEAYSKTPIDWDRTGGLDDRVAKFVSVIKENHPSEVLTKISGMVPYNGCATCDQFTCSCYQVADGAKACATCDGCNQFQACQTCDVTCHEETRACTCNTKCYTEAKACTCDQQRYLYKASCSCNQQCYEEPSCNCNTGCFNYSCGCEGCNACNGCNTDCSCNGVCNAACYANVPPCSCNAGTCYQCYSLRNACVVQGGCTSPDRCSNSDSWCNATHNCTWGY